MNTAARQLEDLGGRIAALQGGSGSASALSNEARASTDLLGALPLRYAQVLLNLLDRLESSALFSEESCSFSQKDLLDNLQVWVGKARAQLSS